MDDTEISLHNPMKNEKRKINLMSIIDSLHANSSPKVTDEESNIDTSRSLHDDQPVNTSTHGMNAQEFREIRQDLNAPGPDAEQDVLSNMLNLLYQSSLNLNSKQRVEEEGDPPLLEMQNSTSANQKSIILQLVECLANGTDQAKSILKNDVNIIFECKRCRGMFRALPNLIRHKKDYCRDAGQFSLFMNRESNSTEAEDVAFKQILDTLRPPEQSTVALEIEDLPRTRSAVRQKVVRFSGASAFNTNKGSSESIQNKPTGWNNSRSSQETINEVSVALNGTSTNVSQSLDLPKREDKNDELENNPTFFQSVKTFPKPKPTCPLCSKQMSERKNLRRHLIRVHMLSMMQALRLMNRKSPTEPRSNAEKGNETSNSCSLMEKSIGTLKIGSNKKIFVLPSNYGVKSLRCPVCNRMFRTRTNVKRHLLEAHHFVVKGERKYFQLKYFSDKVDANDYLSSLRNLRFTEPTNKDSVSSVQVASDDSEHELSGQETSKLPRKIMPSQTASNVPEYLKSNFDEGGCEPGSEPALENRRNDLKSTSEKGATNDGKLTNFEIDSISSKCLTCDRSFGRRQTLQKHMMSVHNWDKERFCNVYDNSQSPENKISPKSSKVLQNGYKESQKMKTNETEGTNLNEPLRKRPKMLKVKIERDPACLPRKQVTCTKTVQSNTELNWKSDRNNFPLVSVCKLDGSKMPVSSKTNEISTRSAVSRTDLISYAQVLQTASSTSTVQTSLATSTTIRHTKPLIQIKLNKPIVTTKRTDSSKIFGKAVKMPLNFEGTKIQSGKDVGGLMKNVLVSKVVNLTNDVRSSSPNYDIEKCVCYMCEKKFDSSMSMKRHLVEIHSFSIEDALASSYDCSSVSKKDQEAGLALGFDIQLAKCLVCNKFYFSRGNLSKHMSKIHHLSSEDLRILSSHSDTSSGNEKSESDESLRESMDEVKELPDDRDNKRMVKKTSRIQVVNSDHTLPSLPAFICKDGMKVVSNEMVTHALKCFPQECLNPHALRCIKCKHKYKKAWDIKMHLLKHIPGLALYACCYCEEPNIYTTCRSDELYRHFNTQHHKSMGTKQRTEKLSDCRIDNRLLWKAYGLPDGKF